MDDSDFMCDLAVQAMEDLAVEIGDTRGAKEVGYEALMDFDVDVDRKRIAVLRRAGMSILLDYFKENSNE